MTNKSVVDFVYKKFHEEITQNELRSYNVASVNWIERTEKTIKEFLPVASDLAIFVSTNVPKTLNSAFKLRDLFNEKKHILAKSKGFEDWIAIFEQNLDFNASLAGSLESQQVSSEIQRQVESWEGFNSTICANGKSIYPDFIFKDRDYSQLPLQDRKLGIVHGPCVQGKKQPRPSNVPDGIELKTNKGNRIRVDAHAPHIGLHLAFTWDFDDANRVSINGAWLGFITENDHKEASRNSKTTTVKYSFGHNKFISLLD